MRFLGSLLCAVAKKGCCEEKERKLHFFFLYQTQAMVLLWPTFGARWVFWEGVSRGTRSSWWVPIQASSLSGWQSHQPVSSHSLGMSYSLGMSNNPLGSGRSSAFPAHPPHPRIPRACQHLLAHPCLPWALAAPSPSLGEPGAHSCPASPALCFPW